MNTRTLLAITVIMAIGLAHLLAQDKKGKPGQKKANVAQTAATDSVGDAPGDEIVQHSKDSSVANRYFLFPDFYSYWPAQNNDTILKYDCFDIDHHLILMDTLTDANDIHFITYTKTYDDHLKTYIDPDGRPRPQPVSRTLSKFERTGTDTWISTDITSGYTVSLQEHRDHIVRKDTTVVVDPITGTRHTTIRKYYKVTEIEGGGSIPKEGISRWADNQPANKANPESYTHYYTVPEFYFHWPQRSRDTIFEFECYDDRDSIIPQVSNYDSVHYYSLLKKFIDSTHTYRDNDGSQKPLPVSLIVKRYDAKGKDKWICIEYPQNRFTDLKGFRDNIVRVDTEAVVDPISGAELLNIYRHYKVIKN
jgi:hypothetical protein